MWELAGLTRFSPTSPRNAHLYRSDVLERTVWELHGMHVAAAAGGTGASRTAEGIVRQARRRRQRQRERELQEGWRRHR